MPEDLAPYLRPTWFVDADHPRVLQFARRVIDGQTEPRTRALHLFYAVRDTIRYSPYSVGLDRDSFRASTTLAAGQGWCVTKACLLAAASRAVGIPCRLGYADVRNHLATEKLLAAMGTDVFYYHGYNEFLLDGRWVKATVAFNASLCQKARLKPLDWDGFHDSLYHPYDVAGNRHMEYLHDYGAFDDIPYEAILAKFKAVYPMMKLFRIDGHPAQTQGNFEADVEAEARRPVPYSPGG